MLTGTAPWQNQGISHGLQIGKDQEGSIQDTDHGYHVSDIGLVNDIAIVKFKNTVEGKQTLPGVV